MDLRHLHCERHLGCLPADHIPGNDVRVYSDHYDYEHDDLNHDEHFTHNYDDEHVNKFFVVHDFYFEQYQH